MGGYFSTLRQQLTGPEMATLSGLYMKPINSEEDPLLARLGLVIGRPRLSTSLGR